MVLVLLCVIVGEQDAFPVDIDSDQPVGALKDKIKEKNADIPCAARKLKLFLAKVDNTWLSKDCVATVTLNSDRQPVMNEAHASQRVFKRMDETLDVGDYVEPDFVRQPGEIHVLIVPVEPPPAPAEFKILSANKKQRLEWRSTGWGSHAYDPKSQYFLLEKEDMDGSGLPDVPVRLYCRPTFHNQFTFLREKVLEEGHVGWILGPPGTGKSTTAMAFASCLDRSKWIVTWIHVSKLLKWRCVRLIDDKRKTRTFAVSDLDDVLAVEDDRHHLLLVDGWKDVPNFTKLTEECIDWFQNGTTITAVRRLAFVCSVAARAKIEADAEITTRAVEFPVWSWTLDEYLSAIKDDEMYASVSRCLDVPEISTEEVSRAAKIESKYYYAGGSCRYMLFYQTKDVMKKLKDAVDSLEQPNNTSTQGSRSPSCINRLFGMFQRTGGTGSVSPLISQYAATEVAVTCGAEAIKKFMLLHRNYSNPALDGWMLEMVFFASLRRGGLEILDENGNTTDSWPESTVVDMDGVPALSSLSDPIWIKPAKWNQGGYDAIMVCKQTKRVRMVQVTRAHKHSFRIEYFYRWLDMLRQSPESFEVTELEIVFIVEQNKLSTFRITTVTGQGLLVPFGWSMNDETSSVKVVGIRGLYKF